MQLTSRIGSVAVGILLSCLACTAIASNDVKAVLDGWAEASANLKSIKTYHLVGEAIQKDAKGKSEQFNWDILRDGGRYYVLWNDGEEKHRQSFDGKLWNDLTETKNTATGAIFSKPMESAEVDLDRNLELQAAGRFSLKLADFADAPANLGNKVLREAYAKNEKSLTVLTKGAGFELRLDPAIAKTQMLPQRVVLASFGQGLYPVEIELLTKTSQGTIKYLVTQTDFKTEGDIAYPGHVTATTTRIQPGGNSQVLISQETKLTLDLNPKISDDEFSIKFPENAQVHDDREVKPVSSTLATTELHRSFPVIPVVIGCVVVIFGLAFFFMSRRQK